MSETRIVGVEKIGADGAVGARFRGFGLSSLAGADPIGHTKSPHWTGHLLQGHHSGSLARNG
jgi:hypothetical protein